MSEPSPADDRTKILRPGNVAATSTDFTVTPAALGAFGGYELLEEIGVGGMGVVYRARQNNLGRIVALKTIRDASTATAWESQRFRKEAEAAAQLDHPNIVPVYDFGQIDGQLFFTMAYVDGEGLDVRLRRGPLDNRQAAAIVRKVADAVEYAHRKGVVHRDLKPANVMIDRSGGVKVTDFGIARRLTVKDWDLLEPDARPRKRELAGTLVRLTAAGTVLGTPGYMAPEQALDASRAGPAADIWALGAILYACLTGRPPFLGANQLETMTLAVDTEPLSPEILNPAADPLLAEICRKCLKKLPSERYRSAGEVADELARWRQDQPPPSPWPERQRQALKWLNGAPEVVPLVAGLLVHRLGNIQEGIFVGCALAGLRFATRKPEGSRLATAAVANLVFVVVLFLVGAMRSGQWDGMAWGVSVVAVIAATVTIACGWGILDERLRRWNAPLFLVATVGIAISTAAVLSADRLNGLGETWMRWRTLLDDDLGRVASWIMAVPMGFCVGALFAAKPATKNRLLSISLTAAILIVVFAGLLRAIRPEGPVETARFSFLGPGPALAIAERQTYRTLAAAGPYRWQAGLGVFWLKMLLLIAPVFVGTALTEWAAQSLDEPDRNTAGTKAP